MFVVLTYDIEMNNSGPKRLNKVAKICQGYGVRVQCSVFELEINIEELTELKAKLSGVIDSEKDSIRIYNFGNTKKNNKIEIIGKKEKIEITEKGAVIF